MNVVLPICAKDVDAALRNLAWCLELDSQPQPFVCYVSHETTLARVGSVIEAARRVFHEVRQIHYVPVATLKWPIPHSAAFRAAATAMARQREPWLWWEQDAVPLKPGWLGALAAEYARAQRPFMGALGEKGTRAHDHLNGVAIYPADACRRAPSLLAPLALPFDVRGGRVVLAQARITRLIQHVWSWEGPDGGAPVFTPATLRHVQKEAVLFHRCKDASLIGALKHARANPPAFADCAAIPMMAHIDGSSGYGIYSSQLIAEFLRRDYDVRVNSSTYTPHCGVVPPEVRQRITTVPNSGPWEFVLYPCVIQPASWIMRPDCDYVYMTMWESTRLVSLIDPARTKALQVLNRVKVVIVPNAWNASCFSAAGVDTPIRVAPLGIPLELFPLMPNNCEGTLVFGTAARVHSGGVRKGFPLVIQAFQKAFPREKNARLEVKCFPEDPPMETGGDARIRVIQRYMSLPELLQWYHGINVLVSGSASEGWGRHQQEAMCVGRPVIGVNFGGVCEFFNEENGYACPWTLEPGEGIYATMGHYAKPVVEGLAAQMIHAFEDRALLACKAKMATASARRFSIEHSADKVLDVLREFEFIQ